VKQTRAKEKLLRVPAPADWRGISRVGEDDAPVNANRQTVGLSVQRRYNRRSCKCTDFSSMRKIIPVLPLLLAALPMAAEAAGDAAAGETKAYTCTGCHGIPGYKNVYPTYKVPKIGGQNYTYLVNALQAYKSGNRTHTTMNLQAQGLSQADIEDIAAWLSSLAMAPTEE
jgi:cytochrome c553